MTDDRQSGKKRRKGKRRKRRLSSLEIVLSSFVACPRCSFFIAAYRINHTDFEEAVEQSHDGWLALTWSQSTRQLLHKSFGGEIEGELLTYETICPDCRRVYSYRSAELDRQDEPIFEVLIRPG